jgi:hypothetical protein
VKLLQSKPRTDWLREVEGLLLAAVVISGLVGVVGAIATLVGQPIEVGVPSGDILKSDALLNVNAGVRIDQDSYLPLTIGEPSGGQLALSLLTQLPTYALTTTVLVLFWRTVRTARRTDPFTGAIVGRIRLLGALLVLGAPTAYGIQLAAEFMLSGTVSTGAFGAGLDATAPMIWIIAGFGLLAVGEIVQRGQVIRAELDGVV